MTDPHTWPSIVVYACSRVSTRTELPFSGTCLMILTKFMIASRQSSNKLQLGLIICFCTCCVSFRATSWMTSTYSATSRSSSSWLRVQGLIGRRNARSMARAMLPFRMRGRLQSGPQSPCHPCSCGREYHARPSAGRGIRIWSSCVIRPLLHGSFGARVDESDSRTSLVCSHCGRTHSADPNTQTRH